MVIIKQFHNCSLSQGALSPLCVSLGSYLRCFSGCPPPHLSELPPFLRVSTSMPTNHPSSQSPSHLLPHHYQNTECKRNSTQPLNVYDASFLFSFSLSLTLWLGFLSRGSRPGTYRRLSRSWFTSGEAPGQESCSPNFPGGREEWTGMNPEVSTGPGPGMRLQPASSRTQRAPDVQPRSL